MVPCLVMVSNMPTRAYFTLAANDRAALETEKLALLKVVVDRNASWVDRTRAQARLAEIDRLLKQQPALRPAERQAQQRGEQRAEQQAKQRAEQTAQQPVHTIQCAPGYKAITEHPDGTGAILITPIEPKSK